MVAVLLLTACSGGQASTEAASSERPVTGAEAEQLALIRFRNFDRGVVPVRLTLRVDDQALVIEGDVDMRRHRGYAAFTASGAQSSTGLIQWTSAGVALLPDGVTVAQRPPPAAGWTVRPLEPSASRLDTALAITLALAADRPENPVLLQQGGAAYVRSQDLRGLEVGVFRGPANPASGGTTGPSRLTYFVDDTGLLRRVVVDLPGSQGPLSIDLLDGEGQQVPLIRSLRAARNGSG